MRYERPGVTLLGADWILGAQCGIRTSNGRVDLNVSGTVGKEDLTGGKREHTTIKGLFERSVGRSRNLIQIGSIKLEK
jgi:hypothetical protein